MDDAFRVRALEAVGIDMAHNVVADEFFARFSVLVVDVVLMGNQLVDLLLRDGQAKLMLGFCQRDP